MKLTAAVKFFFVIQQLSLNVTGSTNEIKILDKPYYISNTCLNSKFTRLKIEFPENKLEYALSQYTREAGEEELFKSETDSKEESLCLRKNFLFSITFFSPDTPSNDRVLVCEHYNVRLNHPFHIDSNTHHVCSGTVPEPSDSEAQEEIKDLDEYEEEEEADRRLQDGDSPTSFPSSLPTYNPTWPCPPTNEPTGAPSPMPSTPTFFPSSMPSVAGGDNLASSTSSASFEESGTPFYATVAAGGAFLLVVLILLTYFVLRNSKEFVQVPEAPEHLAMQI